MILQVTIAGVAGAYVDGFWSLWPRPRWGIGTPMNQARILTSQARGISTRSGGRGGPPPRGAVPTVSVGPGLRKAR